MSRAVRPEFGSEKLKREHDMRAFECANLTNAALNEWLRKFAWTNQQADSARTHVALEGNRVVEYYALTTGSEHRHESPERVPGDWPIIRFASCCSPDWLWITRSGGKGSARRFYSMRCRALRKPPISLGSGRFSFTQSTTRRGAFICTLNLRNRRLILHRLIQLLLPLKDLRGATRRRFPTHERAFRPTSARRRHQTLIQAETGPETF